MTFDVDSLQEHIPFYLTAEDKRVLLRELEAIASGGSANYFLNSYRDSFASEMLQGDGWQGFQLFLFSSGERRSVRAMVLSNSCDVDPSNRRDVPPWVVFAPLVKLSAYRAMLQESKKGEEIINDKIKSIKAQKSTNIFYLPAGNYLDEDYIVPLDHIHSMPLGLHEQSSDRTKLFTLSNVGFYMLVFKLSVHFCRLQENINRKGN